LKRIGLLWMVSALAVTMLTVGSGTSFAAPGGVGKSTETGDCETEDTRYVNCTRTTAGKTGNADGGPGRTEATSTYPLPIDNAEDPFASYSGTSSGGGGRCTFDDTVNVLEQIDSNENALGSDAPCPDYVPGP
jgi:uncharacterized membrane protein YgcG